MFSKNLYNFLKSIYTTEIQKDISLNLSVLKGSKFFKNKTLFIGSSTDVFGDWIPSEWIEEIFEELYKLDKSITIIFLTKNPKRLVEFQKYFRPNMIAGVTIETDLILEGYETKAPSVKERLKVLQENKIHINILISIEPILKFSKNFFKEILKFKTIPQWIILGFNTSKLQMEYPIKEEVLAFLQDIRNYNQNNEMQIEVLIKSNLNEHKGQTTLGIEGDCNPIRIEGVV